MEVLAVHTVTELDVKKYLGRWYQMYARNLSDASFVPPYTARERDGDVREVEPCASPRTTVSTPTDGLYQYSLITDNLDATLFVLARDVNTFRTEYQQEVQDFLKQEGFTKFYNMPVAHRAD
nr:hypothetical protein BaRGS_028605 [Batillaria attramentaria]